MMESSEMGRRGRQAVEMIPLLLRHKIQVLLEAGHTQKDVAERAQVSADTVRRVKLEAEVTETDDDAARRGRGVGRPSKAAPYAEKVRECPPREPRQVALRAR